MLIYTKYNFPTFKYLNEYFLTVRSSIVSRDAEAANY